MLYKSLDAAPTDLIGNTALGRDAQAGSVAAVRVAVQCGAF